MKKNKACFIMTDAISFNVLCQGQLEYFNEHSNLELTLICGGSNEQVEALKLRNVGNVVYIPFLRKPSPYNDTRALMKLCSYLYKNKFDLIVYSTPKALLLGSLASLFTIQKCKIAIVQGRVYENYNVFKKTVFKFFDKISFLISNQVVFVSKSLADNCIKEKLIDSKKAKVIDNGSFNGVNIELFKPITSTKKSILRQNLGLNPNEFIVSIVGRICVDKGIEDISKVLDKLTKENVKFLFVGNFEDKISEDLVNNIVNNNKGYYIPYSSKIHEIFQISDLHLFLSHREGFGNVAIEAASCKIPTFSYDVVGIKDSVCKGVTGEHFMYKDYDSIAKAIDSAATNLNFKDTYKQSRKWIIDNFEQKDVWNSYLDFYLNKIEDKAYD